MLIKQNVSLSQCKTFFLLLCIGFVGQWNPLYGVTFYLNIADFAASFIQIPTSNISGESSTIASSYLVGEAPIYNLNNKKVGTYSASFLTMQKEDGIHTTISNYLSADNATFIKNRLRVTWFTPTTSINLELESIINSMITNHTIRTTTTVGLARLLGRAFDLIVSSDSEKIYFNFSRKQG